MNSGEYSQLYLWSEVSVETDDRIVLTCSVKVMQWPETMLSKLTTFPCIHWVDEDILLRHWLYFEVGKLPLIHYFELGKGAIYSNVRYTSFEQSPVFNGPLSDLIQQVYVPSVAMHVPPFLHGSDSHGLITAKYTDLTSTCVRTVSMMSRSSNRYEPIPLQGFITFVS